MLLQKLWGIALSKKHDGGESLPAWEWWTYLGISAGLVLMAGMMSGLTLGLMSLDEVDMEVLKRSGTEQEKRYARRIEKVISNQHLLLVTLLLCNAFAVEALPLFLDRLVDPFMAVLLSVSVVLIFGEVFPQAVCTRYGLQVGANSAWLVRALMFLVWPVAAPIAKLLDVLLGGQHTALMRRAQLKALVGLHAQEEGGVLSTDEISIITGALDLTSKTAGSAMTPLDKVFMLDMDRVVDEGLLAELLNTGHSRIPVYRNNNRHDVVGLVLVKELVLLDPHSNVAVRDLKLRRLPQLAADTPMYMLLQLFEFGGSHMALLTKPRQGSISTLPKVKSGMIWTGSSTYWVESARRTGSGSGVDDWGSASEGDPVGIITIEDVIEELLQQEIIDETDRYMDNEQLQQVDPNQVSRLLPDNLKQVYSQQFTPRVGRLGLTTTIKPASGALPHRHPRVAMQGTPRVSAGGTSSAGGFVASATATGESASGSTSSATMALRQPLLTGL